MNGRWSGIQFINDFDYGRQISSAFGAIGGPGGQANNPTENGDKYGGGPSPEDDGTKHGTPLLLRHGSPCLSITTNGNVQSTRAIPLEWDPDKFGGGRDHPVIYPNVQLGKNLTLGWSKDGVTRPIALYQTVLSSPATMDRVQIEAPSAYLLARFNNYYIYFPEVGHSQSTQLHKSGQPNVRTANPDSGFFTLFHQRQIQSGRHRPRSRCGDYVFRHESKFSRDGYLRK